MCWKKLIFKSKLFLLVFVLLFFLSEYVFILTAHEKKVSGTNNFHGGDFTLKSTKGPFSLNDLRGSVVLLFFGYTSCPSVCPISLATISNVFSQMSPGELKEQRHYSLVLILKKTILRYSNNTQIIFIQT